MAWDDNESRCIDTRASPEEDIAECIGGTARRFTSKVYAADGGGTFCRRKGVINRFPADGEHPSSNLGITHLYQLLQPSQDHLAVLQVMQLFHIQTYTPLGKLVSEWVKSLATAWMRVSHSELSSRVRACSGCQATERNRDELVGVSSSLRYQCQFPVTQICTEKHISIPSYS